ncbi:ribonuclease H-like domain-containing protein [Tanacetum coccineum]
MVKMVPYEAFACLCGAEDVVLRESYQHKTREERVRLLVGSPGASTTPICSPGSSLTPIYSPGSSTPPRYSPRASTPQSYSLGTSRNAECLNCKHLFDKITPRIITMTGLDLAAPPTSLSDKLALVTHHHLLTRVPVKLDSEDWNYSGISTSDPTPLTPKEIKVDKIILSWIFTTISDALQKRLVIARQKWAKEAWDFISELVKDNKRSRTSALKTKLRSIQLGDLSMEAYFQKVDSLMTILASLDSPVSHEYVVHYVIAGLPGNYNQDFLKHRVLLRCDSTGDLYTVTTPSPILHTFLVSQHTWHQRLGHPRSEVLRRLVSSDFISCNKEKPPFFVMLVSLANT